MFLVGPLGRLDPVLKSASGGALGIQVHVAKHAQVMEAPFVKMDAVMRMVPRPMMPYSRLDVKLWKRTTPHYMPVVTATNDGGVPYSVSLVAMGPSRASYFSDALANSSPKGVSDEVWTINAMSGLIRHDRAFILDDLRYFEKASREHKHLAGYSDWLRDLPLIYTSKAYPEFPNSVDFPLKEVVNSLGFGYFNNTCAYALAYAIHIGVKTVRLYGMDYASADRGFAEAGRACMEYWVATAISRGMKVWIAGDSSLCDQNKREFYGYSVQPVL